MSSSDLAYPILNEYHILIFLVYIYLVMYTYSGNVWIVYLNGWPYDLSRNMSICIYVYLFMSNITASWIKSDYDCCGEIVWIFVQIIVNTFSCCRIIKKNYIKKFLHCAYEYRNIISLWCLFVVSTSHLIVYTTLVSQSIKIIITISFLYLSLTCWSLLRIVPTTPYYNQL